MEDENVEDSSQNDDMEDSSLEVKVVREDPWKRSVLTKLRDYELKALIHHPETLLVERSDNTKEYFG